MAPTSMPVYYPLAPTIVSVCSSLASLLLLIWLCRLRKPLSQKLIARQLWHLALADVFSSIFLTPWFLLAALRVNDENFGKGHEHALSAICFVCHGNNIPYMTSVFTELHIALAAICTILRHPGVIRVLAKCLPYVWVLGFVVGGIVEILAKASWISESGSCNPEAPGEIVKASIMCVVLVVCIGIYGWGMVTAARRHGGSVEGRAWRRASVFIAAAVVTWMPFVVYSLWHKPNGLLIGSDGRYYYVMSVFLEANGMINTLVYAWQSGFLRKSQHAAKYVCEAQETASMLPGHVSFNVAFRSEVDVVDVAGLTAEANQTADRETAVLQQRSSNSFDVASAPSGSSAGRPKTKGRAPNEPGI